TTESVFPASLRLRSRSVLAEVVAKNVRLPGRKNSRAGIRITGRCHCAEWQRRRARKSRRKPETGAGRLGQRRRKICSVRQSSGSAVSIQQVGLGGRRDRRV